VASPDTQRTIYFSSGGQPAHHTAWADVEVDRLAGKFFSSTRSTIDGAWTRPRYPGFAEFQNEMMVLFTDWFSRSAQPEDLLDELDSLYSRSLAEKYGTDASE
jgi:multiple sugar transport system substrate-binding protein